VTTHSSIDDVSQIAEWKSFRHNFGPSTYTKMRTSVYILFLCFFCIVRIRALGSGVRGGEEETSRDVTGAGQLENSRRSLFSLGEFLAGGSDACPPAGFDALKDFDVNSYFGRWYIHKQIPVAYQTVDQLYCVTAEYSRDTNFCLFCNSLPRIDIINRARQGSVTGEKLGGSQPFFRALIRRPETDPAKITVGVGVSFSFRSNYWVVGAGLYEDILQNKTSIPGTALEWAIVTGGSPIVEVANGKCKPYPGLFNFLGMWMFLRSPSPPSGVIEAVDRYASDVLGLDTSAWLPVEHEGCVYD
jgi:lipocalin